MGLFRIFGGEAKDRLENYQAKQALEKKLGRKVEDHELFSLNANLDASVADPTQSAANPPLVHRESTTPFSDAKAPMSMFLKLGIVGVVLFMLVVGGVSFFIWNMPQATYNRLNPFTPKPPPGLFPPTIAGYQLEGEPVYYSNFGGCDCYSFSGKYRQDKALVNYNLYVFKTPEAAQKYGSTNQFMGGTPRVAEKSDTRMFFIDDKAGGALVQFVTGNKLVYFTNRLPSDVIKFENALPYDALGMAKPAVQDPDKFKESAIDAIAILDEYSKDAKATETKYNGKSFLFKGIVAAVTKSAKGIPGIAIQRAGTQVGLDSTLVVSFATGEAAKVAQLKNGATVKFRGTVNTQTILKTVMIENATIVE